MTLNDSNKLDKIINKWILMGKVMSISLNLLGIFVIFLHLSFSLNFSVQASEANKYFEDLNVESYNIKHSTDFTGSKKINFDIIKDFRNDSQKSTLELLNDAKITYDNLLQATKELRLFFTQISCTDDRVKSVINHLVDEIDQKIEESVFNYQWLFELPLRFSVAISNPSNEEVDFYYHISKPGAYPGFFKNDLWRNAQQFSQALLNDNQKCSYKTEEYSCNMEHLEDSLKIIQQEIELNLSPVVYYPILNHTLFSLTELILLYLEDIYPLALADLKDELHAHGFKDSEKFSNFGYLYHDVFHANFDNKRRVLKTYIFNTLEKKLLQNQFSKELVQKLTYKATEKYKNILNLFKLIIHKKMFELSKQNNTGSLDKYIVGLFIAIHEYPSWNLDMFETDNGFELINIFTKKIISKFQSRIMWESPDDILKTSPINGDSSLSDSEIIQIYKDSLDDVVIDYNSMEKTKVNRSSKRFIEVDIFMKNGKHFKQSFATLYHKFLNSQDNINLLSLAGINIDFPKLSEDNVQQARSCVQDHLERIRIHLIDQVLKFKDMAQSLL